MSRRGNHDGALRQRPNGAWEASISFDGQRFYRSAQSRAEAVRLLNDLKAEHRTGQLVRPSALSPLPNSSTSGLRRTAPPGGRAPSAAIAASSPTTSSRPSAAASSNPSPLPTSPAPTHAGVTPELAPAPSPSFMPGCTVRSARRSSGASLAVTRQMPLSRPTPPTAALRSGLPSKRARSSAASMAARGTAPCSGSCSAAA